MQGRFKNRRKKRVRELKINMLTYHPQHDWTNTPAKAVVRQADGVQIVLGTHEAEDTQKPDVQIERRASGWAIFLHPLGGSDACAHVYFHDDGRSWLVREGPGPTPKLAEREEAPWEVDETSNPVLRKKE